MKVIWEGHERTLEFFFQTLGDDNALGRTLRNVGILKKYVKRYREMIFFLDVEKVVAWE